MTREFRSRSAQSKSQSLRQGGSHFPTGAQDHRVSTEPLGKGDVRFAGGASARYSSCLVRIDLYHGEDENRLPQFDPRCVFSSLTGRIAVSQCEHMV